MQRPHLLVQTSCAFRKSLLNFLDLRFLVVTEIQIARQGAKAITARASGSAMKVSAAPWFRRTLRESYER
jgi:hypothetical protein